MQCTELSRGLITASRDDVRYLGIQTHLRSNSFSLLKITGGKNVVGTVVHGGTVSDWPSTGFTEYNGQVYLYGPYRPGITAIEAFEKDPREALRFLKRLVDGYRTLEKNARPICHVHLESIVFLEDGGILFLPCEMVDVIRGHQSLENQLKYTEPYNHPDRSGLENAVFAIGVIAYKIVTGDLPYTGESEEEIHAKIHDNVLIEPHLKNFEVSDEVSRLFFEHLGSGGIALDDWRSYLENWAQHGFTQSRTESERAVLEEKSRKTIDSVMKSFKRRDYWRRNWVRVATITAVVALLLTIPGSIIHNRLQPRSTAGLEPHEVIEVFYTSMNDLDHMRMEDAVIGDAGKEEVRMVMNLFVMTRMRMSVEMTTGFVDPQEWRDAGYPALPADQSVFGVAALEITREDALNGELVYSARYEKWMPNYDEELEIDEVQASPIVGYSRHDRLFMVQDKGDWVIQRIDRLVDDVIPRR